MPSLTFCYWLSSNTFSCIQVPTMKQRAVKNFLNIPIPPTAAAPSSPVTQEQVTVPGAPKYAHPGSFATAAAQGGDEPSEKGSDVPDAEFTDVASAGEARRKPKKRRRRRKKK